MSNTVAKAVMAKGSKEIKPDRLEELKECAKKARDLDAELRDLRERVQEKQNALSTLYDSTIPELMLKMGLDHIGVPPEGNLPGVDYMMSKIVSASISTRWDEEKKKAAFDTLRKYNAELLIKTEVSAVFPKGQIKLAKAMLAAAKKLKIKADLTEEVHHSTLSAWLREFYKGGGAMTTTDLEKIGGYVGTTVRPTERKE